MPGLEVRMDDVRAVMGAVGSDQATLFGTLKGGPMCALFSATYPAHTSALILHGSYPRRTRRLDYPWGPTDDESRAWMGRWAARSASMSARQAWPEMSGFVSGGLGCSDPVQALRL
jgi:pimeloyl-ACP methyl ester carboxylesterase